MRHKQPSLQLHETEGRLQLQFSINMLNRASFLLFEIRPHATRTLSTKRDKRESVRFKRERVSVVSRNCCPAGHPDFDGERLVISPTRTARQTRKGFVHARHLSMSSSRFPANLTAVLIYAVCITETEWKRTGSYR